MQSIEEWRESQVLHLRVVEKRMGLWGRLFGHRPVTGMCGHLSPRYYHLFHGDRPMRGPISRRVELYFGDEYCPSCENKEFQDNQRRILAYCFPCALCGAKIGGMGREGDVGLVPLSDEQIDFPATKVDGLAVVCKQCRDQNTELYGHWNGTEVRVYKEAP